MDALKYFGGVMLCLLAVFTLVAGAMGLSALGAHDLVALFAPWPLAVAIALSPMLYGEWRRAHEGRVFRKRYDAGGQRAA